MKSDSVRFFDTTLRDGEQSPGISLNAHEKLEIAEQLARLKVDIIEAGFPIASEGDFAAVRTIAEKVRGPVICALARAADEDIRCAARAVAPAERGRIHTFISTSSIHIAHQLKKTPAQVLEQAVKSVKLAKSLCPDVEFSAMDATRSDIDYLIRMFSAAIEAGATTINVPDTVGYALPDEFASLIATLIKKTKGGKNVVWSVHCHDDLGLATANTIAGVGAGARQVEVAVNGIGERAGNAALEEVAMAIHTRRERTGLDLGLDLRQLGDTSRKVSKLTGYQVPRNKAVVGVNAFQHESGIHQDGVLKERSTYEIMKPEDVGYKAENIVLGKHSGRHAFADKLEELGYYLDAESLDRAFRSFKALADAKKTVSFQEIEAIALEQIGDVPDQFRLESFQSFTGMGMVPIAAVKLSKGGKTSDATATGDGQVDALCRAIAKATRFKGRLTRYQVSAVTEGLESLGEVQVAVADKGVMMNGRGLATDVIEASAKAYLNAINRLYQKRGNGKKPASGRMTKTRKG
jgi:2-isopropylmalate synthase